MSLLTLLRRRGGGPGVWTYPVLFLPATTPGTPTHYIDQAAAGGGSGSLASPLNAVPSATTAADQVFALKAGQAHPGGISVNHERFVLTQYSSGSLPRLSVLSAPSWTKTATYTNLYDATVTHETVSGAEGTYDSVYAIEEDTQSAAPVTRFRQMTRAASLAACDSTPGTYFRTTNSATSTQFYVHGSDSAAPGTRYAISVTTKYAPFNVTSSTIVDADAARVYLQGSIGGYGVWERAKDAYLHHAILQFGTIHHAVVHGGVVEDVCYAGGFAVTGSIAQVFYVVDAGLTLIGRLRRALFDRVGNGVFTHTSSGTSGNYAEIEVSDSVFVNARDSLGQLTHTAFDSNQTQLFTMSNVIVKDYRSIGLSVRAATIDRLLVWGYQRGVFTPNTSGQEIVIRNSIFIGADSGYSDGAEKASYLIRQGSPTGTLRLENCLVIATVGSTSLISRSTDFRMSMTNCVVVNSVAATTLDAIAWGYVAGGSTVFAANNNVYVAMNGSALNWLIWNGSAGVNQTFAQWQVTSGLDANSQLLTSAGALSTLFRDYAAGDLRWATTGIGAQIAATGRGPRYLPTRWPTIPTADDAHAALVANTAIQV